MTTTNGTFNFFDSWKVYQGTVVNKLTDTFKMIICSSALSPNAATQQVLADIVASEISGNGYARATLTNVSWANAAGISVFDFDDPSFTAFGGPIQGRFWVVYDDTPTSPVDPLVAYGLLDSSNADVVTTDGNVLRYIVPPGGFYVLN